MKHGLTVSTGKAISQAINLLSVAILTRQLGPELFGVLALIRTVAAVTEAYANFNTWQTVIKYGTEAMAAKRTDEVKRIIKLSMAIDVVTAAIAAAVIVGISFVIPAAFGWSHRESLLCALYSVTVLTRVAGTSDGIFRICNAYRAQAVGDILATALPTLAVIIATLLHVGLGGAVIALICGEVVGNLVDMGISFYVAARHGFSGWRHTSLTGIRARHPGILRFMLATNGQLTVKKTQVELDMIVVGAMLGRFASGLFKLVKQLGRIPSLVFMPFEQVLFAELSHRAAASDYIGFRRLQRRFTALVFVGALAMWALAALIAEPLVRVIANDDFIAAVPALRVYLLAMAISVASTPTQRALVALGRPGSLLAFDFATLILLFVTTISGVYLWGIEGVAAAVLLHKLTQLTWSSWLVARVLRQRIRHAAAQPPAPAPT
jgi:O-antigen/teichoic acid export membrane protein